MRRIVYSGVGLCAIASGVFVFAHFHSRAEAQQPAVELTDPDIIFSENPELSAAEKAAYESTLDAEIETTAEVKPEGLREQYLELLSRKVELMTDEQIAQAVQQVTSDIGELEAGRTLERITGELRALIEAHPESKAAQRARAMLVTPENGGAYYGVPAPEYPAASDAPYYNGPTRPTPVPDVPSPRSSLKVRPIN